MSFGYSLGDAFLLSQLAWRILQNSRKACGEHDELTRELSTLHTVLRRLGREFEKAESPINSPGETAREELQAIMGDCGSVLDMLDKILEKYAVLSEGERSTRKLWTALQFGNGRMVDLGDLRSKVTFYTSAITLYLNLASMGSAGRIERYMTESGGIIRDIQLAINTISAHTMSAGFCEGSVLTSYPDDDRAIWKEFRRDLIGEGFKSSVIHRHKALIQAYVRELGSRGAWDVDAQEDIEGHPEECSSDNEVRQAIRRPSENCGSVDEARRNITEHSSDYRSKSVQTLDILETEPVPRASRARRPDPLTEISGQSSVFTDVRSSARPLEVENEPIAAAVCTSIVHSRTGTIADIQTGPLNSAVELTRLWYLFYNQLRIEYRRWASATSHDRPDREGASLVRRTQHTKAKVDSLDAENLPDPDFFKLQQLILDIGMTLVIMVKFTSQPSTWKKYRWLARCSESLASFKLVTQIMDEERLIFSSISKSIYSRIYSRKSPSSAIMQGLSFSWSLDHGYLPWGPLREASSPPRSSQ